MRNKMTLAAIASLAALAVACGSGNTDSGSTGSGDQQPTQDTQAEKVAGLNQPARDGKFEFTVTGMKCGATHVGPDGFGADAQGMFCLANVTVKNIGDQAQLFDGSSQKAFDGKGTQYSNDGSAEMYANENSATFLEEINPGNTVKGRLIFDVPEGTKLTRLELHDSPFSGGVQVNLS